MKMAFTALSFRAAVESVDRPTFGRSSMRESGTVSSTPVAAPTGAPPVPVLVPDTAPELTSGGGTDGNADGIVVGGSKGAGAVFFGSRLGFFSLAPLPTGPALACGWTEMYWMCSTGVFSFVIPKNAAR